MHAAAPQLVGLIFAPGLGSRLAPFTDGRPKALVPIWGSPILWYQLEVLREMGAQAGAVLVRDGVHFADAELAAVGDAAGLPLSILRVDRPADHSFPCPATRAAVRDHTMDRSVITLNCDLLVSFGWRQLALTHAQRGADLTIATAPAAQASLGRGGRVRWATSRSGWVRAMHHAPQHGAAAVEEVGLTVTGPRTWELIETLPLTAADPWTDELIPTAIEAGLKVQTVTLPDYWRDVGTWPRILQAHADIRRSETAGLDLPVPAAARNSFGDEKSVVAGGARVDPAAFIGSRVTLERDVIVDASVVMWGAHVGAGATVRRSVVLPRARIEAGSTVIDSLVPADGPAVPLGPEMDGLRLQEHGRGSSEARRGDCRTRHA